MVLECLYRFSIVFRGVVLILRYEFEFNRRFGFEEYFEEGSDEIAGERE